MMKYMQFCDVQRMTYLQIHMCKIKSTVAKAWQKELEPES